jgi:hypothetical protein
MDIVQNSNENAEVCSDLETDVESQAWLLSLSNGNKIAIGREELRHLLTDPALYRLPRAPRFCGYLVEWERHLLPLYDLGAWLQETGEVLNRLVLKDCEEKPIFAVVGFNLGSSRVEYGIFAITEPPALITVKDSDFVLMEAPAVRKKMVARSNFDYQGITIPVINIKYLFTGVFSQ